MNTIPFQNVVVRLLMGIWLRVNVNTPEGKTLYQEAADFLKDETRYGAAASSSARPGPDNRTR